MTICGLLPLLCGWTTNYINACVELKRFCCNGTQYRSNKYILLLITSSQSVVKEGPSGQFTKTEVASTAGCSKYYG